MGVLHHSYIKAIGPRTGLDNLKAQRKATIDASNVMHDPSVIKTRQQSNSVPYGQ
jgi:hypothetical protein